jgi:hypothetical protein
MSQLIGGAGGLGWVAAKAVLMFAVAGLTTADVYALLRREGVDDLGQVGYLLYETRGATTLVGAGREPGRLTRDAISAAGFRDVAEEPRTSSRCRS